VNLSPWLCVALLAVNDPVYREAVKYRQAAAADSRLIRLSPVAPGKPFGQDANGRA